MKFSISIIAVSCTLNFVSLQTLRPGGEPMLIVSLYHQCNENKNESCSSGLCQAAVNFAYQQKRLEWNKFLLERKFDRIDGILSMSDFEYRSINFCGFREVVSNTVDLKLSQSYFVSNKTQNPPKWNGKTIKSWQFSSRIVLVIIHAPQEVSKILQGILSGQDFVALIVDSGFRISESLNGKNVQAYANIFHENARRLFVEVRMAKRLAVIFIDTGSPTYQLEFELFRGMLLNNLPSNQCPKYFTMNIKDMNKTSNSIFKSLLEEEITVTVVIGKSSGKIF